MSTKKPAATKAAKKRAPAAAETMNIMADLASAVRDLKNPTMVATEPMVGIRNISSYTVGLRSPFPNDESDIQLAGPRYMTDQPTTEIADGNTVGQVSHKWWLQLRREPFVRKGMIVRDDSVLSAGVPRAPEDTAGSIHPEAAANAIHNAFEWIEGKTETELQAALDALTAEEALRRLITAVNQRIELERRKLDLPVEGSPATNDGIDAEERALQNLPWRYKKVEEFCLAKLEQMFRNREPAQ